MKMQLEAIISHGVARSSEASMYDPRALDLSKWVGSRVTWRCVFIDKVFIDKVIAELECSTKTKRRACKSGYVIYHRASSYWVTECNFAQ